MILDSNQYLKIQLFFCRLTSVPLCHICNILLSLPFRVSVLLYCGTSKIFKIKSQYLFSPTKWPSVHYCIIPTFMGTKSIDLDKVILKIILSMWHITSTFNFTPSKSTPSKLACAILASFGFSKCYKTKKCEINKL